MADRIIFIIFHQGITPTLTGTDTYPDLVRYFGVNKNYQKKYLLTNDSRFELLDKRKDVFLEYTLPKHDNSIQEKGFMETSAYIHIFENKLTQSVISIPIGIITQPTHYLEKKLKMLVKRDVS